MMQHLTTSEVGKFAMIKKFGVAVLKATLLISLAGAAIGATQGVNSTAAAGGATASGSVPIESARTLGSQDATNQQDSVRTPSGPPACTNGATNWPTCTITTVSTESQVLACPPPQTGAITQQRSVTYVNGAVTSTGAWNTVSNTCAIPAVVTTGSETQTLSCPAPQTGSIDQQRSVTYTNGVATSYGAWTTTSNTCTSGPVITTGTENQTIACPAPQTGTITQQRTVTYSNGVPTSYGAWTTTSNSCSAGPVITTQNESQTIACPSPQSGTIWQSRTVTYTNGVQTSATSWTNTGDNCTNPPPVCVSTGVTACEGPNLVTRDSCSGSILGVGWSVPPCYTPPACVATAVAACEGDNRVTRDSCTGSILGVDWGACAPPPPDPLVTVTACVCGGASCGSVVVPQSQAASAYWTLYFSLYNSNGLDGSCGVG